jgi:DNA-binding CsgD family transcriptional regulator
MNRINFLNEGKINKTVDFWQKKGCPFQKALALFEGVEEDKKNALLLLQQLGAIAVSEKINNGNACRRASKKIPRGLRESTRTNPAQLTNRELDVLQLLQKGNQNKEIAGTLFISPKTAEHHIPASYLSSMQKHVQKPSPKLFDWAF